MDTAILKKILACFIIAVSVFRLVQFYILSRRRGSAEEGEKGDVKWYSYLALVGAGVIHGMFSSGGPLAIIYSSSAIKDRDSFRSTMCMLWVTLNSILTVSYALDGSITTEMLRIALVMIPFVIGGIIAGNLIVRRVNNKVFSVVVYACLLVTGIFLLV